MPVWIEQPLIRDSVSAAVTLLVALLWLRTIDAIAHRGWLDPKLSRKIIHIGTGPLFVLCWPFYSSAPSARYFAMLVPLVLTMQFMAVGLGWIEDPQAVQATTRNGEPQEMLKGPLYYGLVFVVATVIFWRASPVGIVALMLMCGGDGLADIVGRRFGRHKLPFSPHKSWVGSAAMFGGSFVFALGIVTVFNRLQLLEPALNVTQATPTIAAIALIATLVEALPFPDIDNLTLTGTAIVLGIWWF